MLAHSSYADCDRLDILRQFQWEGASNAQHSQFYLRAVPPLLVNDKCLFLHPSYRGQHPLLQPRATRPPKQQRCEPDPDSQLQVRVERGVHRSHISEYHKPIHHSPQKKLL